MKLKELYKKYDSDILLENFSIEIPDKMITVILGPSGVGKTTILNIIAGNVEYSGTIENNNKGTSMVFANQRLIPSLSVYGNLDYILHECVKDKSIRKTGIKNMLSDIGLAKNVGNMFPHELSTGMAQRVSMARAFLYPAELMLLDEPFRGVDIALKTNLINQFLTVWEQKRPTVVMVTHDINEALFLADKIVILDNRPVKIEKELFLESVKMTRNFNDKELQENYVEIMNYFCKKNI